MIILKPLLENLHSHISDHEQLSANKDVQYWFYWSSSQLQSDPKCRFLQQSSWTGWISRLFLMLHFYFCFKSRLNFELHDDTTLRPAACRTQIIGGDSEVNEIKNGGWGMFLNKDKTSTVSYVLWERMTTAATASPNGENYSIYWNFNRHENIFSLFLWGITAHNMLLFFSVTDV